MIVSNAARLKPEIRLAQAISLFEASLTGAQKAEFRNSRAHTLESPPNSTDVMRVTADVDHRMKGHRCLGPRFTNFLSTAQQFAALGDVVVGGSQNILACGIWSLVRMSILVGISAAPGRTLSYHLALEQQYTRGTVLNQRLSA